MTDKQETGTMCRNCDLGGRCEECLQPKEDKFGHVHISDYRIAVRCLICDGYQEISQEEAESIHILVCDDCKRAMGWLKERIRNQKMTGA